MTSYKHHADQMRFQSNCHKYKTALIVTNRTMHVVLSWKKLPVACKLPNMQHRGI